MVSDDEIAKALNEACAAMQDSGYLVGSLQRQVQRLKEENNRLRDALYSASLKIDPGSSNDASSK